MKDNAPIVIGAGLAGLMTALRLAPRPVTVLSAAPLGQGAASGWAQGGLAAAVGADDSVDLHVADTLAAGAGLCCEAVVRRVVGAAPALVDRLAALGVRFDRADGRLVLGLEAGHARRRITHAGGDASGREILRAVIAAVRACPAITVLENTAATKLLLRDGRIAGVLASGPAGHVALRTTQTVIATGGLGALYQHTTNPAAAAGGGLMLAAQAGAALGDLEFVQFHPTALDAGLDPMPLISEAVRGEGAILVDETGRRFMEGQGRAELEPRDVVSRAVWAHMVAGHRVFLDARMIADFAGRFPAVTAICAAAGIDPAMPIPVRPAAHYHMGGITVDAHGRSTVPGLWACGEAACTGLHGGNRLASNSLLEAAVTGTEVGEDLAGLAAEALPPATLAAIPPTPDPAPIRAILSQWAGVRRHADGLKRAAYELTALMDLAPTRAPASLALMMVMAMLRREESRGGHCRTDFPQAAAPRRYSTTLAASLDIQGVAPGPSRWAEPF